MLLLIVLVVFEPAASCMGNHFDFLKKQKSTKINDLHTENASLCDGHAGKKMENLLFRTPRWDFVRSA